MPVEDTATGRSFKEQFYGIPNDSEFRKHYQV